MTVNYYSSALIIRLVQSLPDNYGDFCQLVIVNNSAQDLELSQLANDFSNIKIMEAGANLGFGRACNLALNWIYAQNQQSIVWLINPDTYFKEEIWQQANPFQQAILFFEQYPQISVLGTVVENSRGEIVSAGGSCDRNNGSLQVIDSLPPKLNQDYYLRDWVSGCSMLINLGKFPQVPQFCDRYFLYYEDLDFCLRYGQQGHQIAIAPCLRIKHDTSSITNRNIYQKYRYITQSYLIHIEKYSNLQVLLLTHLRISFNTLRLIIFKPQQGLGKLIGIFEYWHNKILTTHG